MAAGDELAQQRTPIGVDQVRADAEGGKGRVAMLAHLRGVLAAQHVDDVAGAETLPGAHDAGKQLLRLHGAVAGDGRREANVAVAAVRCGSAGFRHVARGCRRAIVAEVAQQGRAPARRDFAPAEQRVEFGAFDALVLLVRFGFVHHLAQANHVLQAVGHPRFRRRAVAPGAARFLVVRLHALGQIQVGDETHIRFVDAHAEGDGGHHDHAVFAEKPRLVPRPLARGHAGVVGQGVVADGTELFGHGLHLAPRQAVDDAGLAVARG